MLQRVRYLAGQSLIYGMGTILSRSISLILLPLYTQYLPPGAFGILAVITSICDVLLGIFPLGLPDTAIRFYYDTSDEQQRRGIIGSIWLMSLFSIGVFTILLLVLGPLLGPWIFPDVPFHPYLLLALLITLFQGLNLLPSAFFRAQENAKRFVSFNVGTFLIIALLSIWLVTSLGLGATGALIARLTGWLVSAIAATFLLLRFAEIKLQPTLMKAAVLFGLPLVPTRVFSWALRLSDRIIMQQYVSLDSIGIYSLGYQVGRAVNMLNLAINSAWAPFYYRTCQEQGKEAGSILAPIITYIVLVSTAIGLVIAILAPEIIQLFAQSAYYPAHRVVPWVVATSIVQVFITIGRQGIMYAKKTKWDPAIVLVGSGTNLGLNLLLLPRFGYIAAAWTTLLAYLIMGALMFTMSQRVHPVAYEYRRLFILLGTAAGIFFVSRYISSSSVWTSFASKMALISLYPMFLWLFGFVSDQERRVLRILYARLKLRLLAQQE